MILSILIISYNTREMTLECLRSVFRESRTDGFEVIVVDNASTDASPDAIESEFAGRITLVRSPENLGFARANNAAAAHATGEFLLLLNPDTVVLDGAIDRLLAFARERPDAGIWGGRTVFADGSLNPASCWTRQTLWSLLCQAAGLSSAFRRSPLFNPEGLGGWDRSTERAVDIVSGCFLMIRRALWDRLGGFHPDFFMYGEEADLCLRARALGASPRVTPEATIIHHGGASETVRADKMCRLMAAKMRLIQRHFPPATRALAALLFAAWPWSRMIATGMLAGPDARRRARASMWREVFRRRDEWMHARRAEVNRHARSAQTG
jgi:GT2 family glycosyltransferase